MWSMSLRHGVRFYAFIVHMNRPPTLATLADAVNGQWSMGKQLRTKPILVEYL